MNEAMRLLRAAEGVGLRRRPPPFLGVVLVLAATALPLRAQEIRGRVYDSENDEPVGVAGVFMLDAEREVVQRSVADLEGRYSIRAPGAGEYYLVVQRLGYFENETPLFSVVDSGAYGVDFELRPEPIRLDPLQVSVSNEKLENYLSLALGENPNGMFGFRVIQGIQLEEARSGAKDNTDVLRRLFIPVSWGARVCVGSGSARAGARSSRTGWRQSFERSEGASFPCGSLYVDGYPCPAEFLESIDLQTIGVVTTLDGDVHLYRRDFDWTFRPGSRTGAC